MAAEGPPALPSPSLVRRILWRTAVPVVAGLRTKRRIKASLGAGTPVKLEIGSGRRAGVDGWTTLDQNLRADLYWDLGRGIPYPDDSLDMIYSSHVFEHFPYRNLRALVEDCRRALRPGGCISVAVPDATIYLRAYAEARSLGDDLLAYEPAVISDRGIDLLNYIAYMDDTHKHLFDEDNLVQLLADCGFVDARRRDFVEGLDGPGRRHESIYAEAWAPE